MIVLQAVQQAFVFLSIIAVGVIANKIQGRIFENQLSKINLDLEMVEKWLFSKSFHKREKCRLLKQQLLKQQNHLERYKLKFAFGFCCAWFFVLAVWFAYKTAEILVSLA